MVTVTQVTRCISTEIIDRGGQVLERSYVEVSMHVCVCVCVCMSVCVRCTDHLFTTIVTNLTAMVVTLAVACPTQS